MWWAEFLLPVLKDVYGRAPTAFSSRSGVVDAGLLRGVCAAGKMPLQASGAKPPFAHGDPGFLHDFATGPCPLACTACASVLPPPPSLVMVVSPGGEGKRYLRSCCRRRHSHCCRRWQVSGNVVTMPVFVGGEGRPVFRRWIAGFLRHSSELSDGPFFHDGATRSLAQ